MDKPFHNQGPQENQDPSPEGDSSVPFRSKMDEIDPDKSHFIPDTQTGYVANHISPDTLKDAVDTAALSTKALLGPLGQ